MFVQDRGELSGARITKDGYLVADCRVSRTGIQQYHGMELGLNEPRKLYTFYRPPEEVFAKDSLASYAFKPVTNEHPMSDVSADNWRHLAVGGLSGDVARDGEYVRVPLVLMDKSVIEDVQAGKRELSMGYDCTLDWTPGLSPDGTPYDAVMRDIRINHCAVVDAGRAGPLCRIGDERTQPPKETTAMKTVVIDGKSYSVADDVADAISGVQTKVEAYSKILKDVETIIPGAEGTIKALRDKLIETEAALADAKAKAEEAEKKAISPADLAKIADARAKLITAAKAISDSVETDGKADADIVSAAVAAKLGAEAIKDKSPEYLRAMFDMLASAADTDKPDPVRDAIKSGGTGGGKLSARDQYLRDLVTAHLK